MSEQTRQEDRPRAVMVWIGSSPARPHPRSSHLMYMRNPLRLFALCVLVNVGAAAAPGCTSTVLEARRLPLALPHSTRPAATYYLHLLCAHICAGGRGGRLSVPCGTAHTHVHIYRCRMLATADAIYIRYI